MQIFYSGKKSALNSNIKLWWAWRYLGWVGHFCVLQFTTAAVWGPEKGSSKRTLRCSQELPPRTPGCNVLPGLESQCTLQGTACFKHFHVWPYMCEQLLICQSHCIIHFLPDTIFSSQCLFYCMQKLPRVITISLFWHGERILIFSWCCNTWRGWGNNADCFSWVYLKYLLFLHRIQTFQRRHFDIQIVGWIPFSCLFGPPSIVPAAYCHTVDGRETLFMWLVASLLLCYVLFINCTVIVSTNEVS